MKLVPSDESREAEVDHGCSLEDSHPMVVLPQEEPAVMELVRGAQRAKVFGNLFGQAKPPLRRFGRYIVLDVLGEGGMGTVLKGYDEQLDRQVALKLLHSDPTEREGQRLKREAQALAKLAHPNVVQVFEVGEAEGQVFVAMELVKGQTLRQWQSEADPPRDWKECVEIYLQAGRGLAAAHAAGLVHRDFKPGNAIVDAHQRVRVLDFGLVREVEAEEHEESREEHPDVTPRPKDDALGSPLTRTGQAMGTPAYMPFEQLDGKVADARSDQFSFCVALYEAVYGERPFKGDTMGALMASVAGGQVRAAPRGIKVPVKLRKVLRRGLAPKPEQRWPSMNALLAELDVLVAPRSRRWVAIGLTGGLAALGGTLALEQYTEVMDRCTGARAELDGVWDQERRHEVEAAVLGTALSYAPDTWERIGLRLDDYAQAWAGKHTEVCEATTVRGEQTEEAMDLRMGCLRDRKVALSAAVMVLADADDAVVQKAVTLVEGLPSLDRCDELDRLQQMRQRVPPPEDPQVAQDVEDLREQLAGIKAKREAGRPAEALKHVEPVVQRAKALGYEPLLAEALVQRARALHDTDEFVEAERDLERAFTLAAKQGHDAVAATAVGQLAWLVGVRQERHESGFAWGKTNLALALGPDIEPTVEADAIHYIGILLYEQGKLSEGLTYYQDALALYEQMLGKNHPSVATILVNIANVLHKQGNLSDSFTHYQRALAISEQAFGNTHPFVATVLHNIGSARLEQGKLPEALLTLQRALAIWEQAFGRNHSLVAHALHNVGIVLKAQGKISEALTHYQRALAIFEQTLGKNHSTTASALANIGNALDHQGKASEALTYHQRAAVIFEQAFGKDHPSVAKVLLNIGTVLHGQGKLSDALSHHQRALAIQEQALGKSHPSVALSMLNIGLVLHEQGKLPEALTHYQRALSIREQALGDSHPDVAYPLVGLAEVALDQRDFDTARAHAERAVSIREARDVRPDLIAKAHFVLARALWQDRTERRRAHALAQQARDVFAGHGPGRADDLAEVEAWLAKHRVR